ncbi:hypothetical protein K490DRAFT_33371 [Saccharata proteae CBS 121410]|uniref:TPR-like protein n=1 Tax=Saccharata proteae CBS 121410 TaxID=1314787 RepID=A0A9P4I241_9PEZI|nr:hypothetical protein K490DRAFT_33371 [Saccharata proteae CBS 121410]
MADLSFLGVDEDYAELKKLNAEVLENPDEFEAWEKTVQAAEQLEGGLNRNSSPQSIAAWRAVYDKFLLKFPLVFAYWKRYADLEFSIAGTEAAELVYERGVASIGSSVELWANYCNFKTDTNHDPDVQRELWERGASCVGIDFHAESFWDKYIEFEERLEATDKVFAILKRVIHIPQYYYAKYFERYQPLAAKQPVEACVPPEVLAQFRAELQADPTPRSDYDVERELRARIDAYNQEIFLKTQSEVSKRWTFEGAIKRPYFLATDLDETELENWKKYLDFEEAEGDHQRITFLYERCLVAAAHYDEIWLRYARWMMGQLNKEEEVRNIYQRASCLYAPIARPAIRLQYALFEEMVGRVDVAHAIYEAILMSLPNHVDTIISWANLAKRHSGIDGAVQVYRSHIEEPSCDVNTKGTLAAECARLIWKVHGDADKAREVFRENAGLYLEVRSFWSSYLNFELEQATSAETESTQMERIKQVHAEIRHKSRLPAEVVQELTHRYMAYLLERGNKNAAKEYLTLDMEING